MKIKGGVQEKGGQDPLTPPPSGHAFDSIAVFCKNATMITNMFAIIYFQ